MRRLGDEAAAIHFIKMIQWLLLSLGEPTGCATYCKLLPLRWGIAMRILKMSVPLQLLLLDVQLLLCAGGEELPVLCCCGVYHS